MNYKILLLNAIVLLTLLNCKDLTTNPDFSKSFVKYYGGTDEDVVSEVQLTSDGGYIMLGSSKSFSSSMDMYVVKTDKNGNKLWERNYGNIGADSGKALIATPDGYLILGTLTNPVTKISRMWLVKINEQNGDTIWTKSYAGSNQRNVFGTSIGSGVDANTYMIGGCISDPINNNLYSGYIIKINGENNEKGKILLSIEYKINNFNTVPNSLFENVFNNQKNIEWVATSGAITTSPFYGRFNQNGGPIFFAGKTDVNAMNESSVFNAKNAIRTPEKSYLITGLSINNAGVSKAYILKINGSNSPIKVWYNNSYGGDKPTVGYGITQTRDGGFVIVGSIINPENSKIGGQSDIFIAKVNQEGSLVWEKFYGGPNNDFATSVKQTIDGGYIVAASITLTSTPTNNSVMTLLKIDAEGNLTNK